MRRAFIATVLLAVCVQVPGSEVGAEVVSDRAAAILVFPRILARRVTGQAGANRSLDVTDTIVQLSNTSTETVNAHCFYVNANSHCSLSDAVCDPVTLGCPLTQDLCLPGWTETDFDVVLTPRQPLAWRATVGLSREDLPLDGVALTGPRGESNAGTSVPPVQLELVRELGPPDPISERQFSGELKCIVVDAAGRGAASNVIKGEATVIRQVNIQNSSFPNLILPTAEKYNAVGIQAIDGDANDDGVLELGGGANEYAGCPSVLIAEHTFDFQELTLVPCTQNFLSQSPTSTVAQFLVFNEFEQRFSTSSRVDCFFRRVLQNIDTPNIDRSIFSAGVAGSLAGQTRIRGVSAGLLGVISHGSSSLGGAGDTAYQLFEQGEREAPDFITVPR